MIPPFQPSHVADFAEAAIRLAGLTPAYERFPADVEYALQTAHHYLAMLPATDPTVSPWVPAEQPL